MPRFQLIRNLMDKLRAALRGQSLDAAAPEWRQVQLLQVETEGGFVPIDDLPFNAETLGRTASRNLESNRGRMLRAGGATGGEVEAASSRQPFSQEGLSQESPRTHCPTCIEHGRLSRTFVGPAFSTASDIQPYLDDRRRYHRHDTNTYRLTYLCSNGHRWERRRWRRCWCGWTAEPGREGQST